ncbi:MAG: hypothetical protein AUJ98_01135 [Bacteroidetes bacterium CG2_30_33_31]|nr:MAG: hypothetical protein AUJ98_01135 [Bacteroidetes bacterium CG2_30_33_31]
MKRSIFTLIAIFLYSFLSSQTILFQEDFEGATLSMSSSSVKNNNNWSRTHIYQSQGLKADSAKVGVTDTTYLTSNTFNCTAMSFVQLQFSQIAKIEFFDAAIIEVSANNGVTWTQLNGGQYMGTGAFVNIGNKFASTSYADWLPANNNAIPTNSWWKSETFNLSSLLANSSQAKIRFTLVDANGTGAAGNYGWLIDDVKIVGSFSELIPPSIAIIPPYPHDTAYTSGPYIVKAKITDNTGIDTALLIYSTSTGVHDTLGMNMIATDTFQASIPFYGFGRSITYYIKAFDSSPAHNADSVGTYTFYCKYSPGGTFVVGTGTVVNTQYGYPTPYGNYYNGAKNQMLILASELQALGAVGGQVSSVAFDVATVQGTTLTGFTIKVGQTTQTALTTTFVTGLSTVYSTTSYTEVAGWNTHTFQTPFVWDGTSNLVIETCFDNYPNGYTYNAIVNQTTTTFASATTYYSDGGGVCPTSTSYNTYNNRPNMKLAMATPVNITHDIGVSQITNPTGGVVAGTPFQVKVKVKNFGIDTIHSGTINWKFDGVTQTAYSFTDTILPGQVSGEFILGTKTVTGGSHNLLTWTDNPNGISDFNVGNDSSSINFYACGSLLSGVYTIGGTSPDYATFADAVLALNQCGINGPVTFNIAAGTYNEHFTLFAINGSSATNTVTFKAANGDSSSVILNYDAAGTVDNYVVKLKGTSYITFKNMTFQAADSAYNKVIVLSSVGHDVSINNNVIKILIPQITDNLNSSLISVSDSTGNNITVEQNLLLNGSRAIVLNSNIARTGWAVKNNTMHEQYSAGISITKAYNVNVIGNIIRRDSISANYEAIALATNTGAAQVYKNQIYATNTEIAYGIILNASQFDSINHAKIYNNFVLVNGNSSSSNLSCGILIYNAPNVDVYYNTVRVTGNQIYAANMTLYDLGTVPNTKDVNIKNNIFTNTAGGYIYYISAVDTSEFVNDYNNIYNWNNGKFGNVGGNNLTFVDWKTKSGGEAHGDTIDPYYVSAGNLHVVNNLLNGRAIPISGITDDIDGELRSVTNPDFGADEFTPSPYDITTLELLTPIGACGLDTNETITVRYKNIGSVTINGNLTASYKIKNSSNIVTENVSASILAGDTLNYAFTTKANLSASNIGFDTTFIIKAWATLTGDNVHQNDTAIGSVASGYIPGLVSITDDTIWYGDKDTLMATGNNIYWWASDTASTHLWNDSIFITPNLYDTTTYWVSDRAGSGLQSIQIGNGTVQNSTTSYPSPYGQFYTGCKEQYLLLASELHAMGAVGGPLESLAFDVVTTNGATSSGHNHDNYTIKLGQTSTTSLTSWTTGLTQVYTASTYQTVTGWNTHQFTTPFVWDGTSNLLVEVCFDNYQGGSSYSYNALVNSTTTSYTSTLDYHSDGGGVCPYTSSASSYMTRPNMKVSIHGQGCFGDRTPVTVYVKGFPQYDAGLDSNLISPVGAVPSGVATPIKGILHNYGQVTMTSVKIPWKINGVIQDTLLWTGNMPYNHLDTVTIGTTTLNGGIYKILAYTTLPNSVADTFNTNDTAKSSVRACLNGTYSIGDTINGTADFGSFNGAIAALSVAGICGNVIFNVDTGTYTEKVLIPQILGMDANNRVTFQSVTGDSTDVTLQFSSTNYTSDYTLKLNGADYFTFKNMTIKGTNASYGGVVEITNNSVHNSFLNNIIETPVSTSSYMRCFYSNGGLDSYTRIENNLILNGYYGIYLAGTNTTSLEKGNVIKNNIISGFYYYGIYTIYQDSIQIESNKVSDGANSVYGYGIYMYYCDNQSRIVKNTLHFAPSSYKYGIMVYYSDGTATKRGLIANNMLSITSGTGANYGLYFYYSSFFDVYYNTINITGGTSTSRAAYIYAPITPASVNFMNNVFRDSTGYTIYMGSYTGINNFDYNSYYTTSPNFSYWGSTNANLAALQTASGKDAHSMTVDPLFFSNTNLHLLSTQLSGYGLPVSAVTDDIDGETRGALYTTIGADEVPLLPFDIGVSKILMVPDTTLEAYTVPFKVIVKNFGTDTVNGFNINYSVNGGTAVVYNYSTAFPSGKIDTVQLASFVSPAGNSNICVTTVLAADSNAFNDGTCKNFFGKPTKDAFVTRMLNIEGGCGLVSDTVAIMIKNVGVDTINAANQAVATTVSFRTNPGASVVTQTMPNVIPPSDSSVFIFSTQASLATTAIVDSIFHIKAWINFTGDNVHYNDTTYQEVESLHTPPAPIAVNVTIPYASPATLTATSPSNDSLAWYDHPYAGSELYTGTPYVTTLNYQDTNYYVEARSGIPPAFFNIGTGTTANSTTGYPSVYGQFYTGDRVQYLIPASELIAAGASAGPITSLGFDIITAAPATSTGANINNFKISLGTTNQSSLSSWVSGLSQVYAVTSYPSFTGFNQHVFNTPYLWDGVSNLVIETCYDNYVNSSDYSTNSTSNFSSTTYTSTLDYHSDGGGVCGGTQTPSTYTSRPNMKLEIGKVGCSSNRVTAHITVGAQPTNDVGISQIIEPTTGIFKTATEVVKVKVKNFGSVAKTNVPVSYKINNGSAVTETIATSIAANDSLIYTFTQTADLSIVGNTFNFKVYTGLTTDTNHLNDTLKKTVHHDYPNYCLSKAQYNYYSEVTDVKIGFNFDNASAATGAMYTNFMQTVAPALIQIGANTNLSVTTNYSPGWSSSAPAYMKMYIDYNRDGTFDASTEEAWQATGTTMGTVTGNLTVPNNATSGPTAMRLVMQVYSSLSAVSPCGQYYYGETEDYMVQIAPKIPHDAGVEMFIDPKTTVSSTISPLNLRIRNYGIDSITSVEIKYNVNGGTTLSHTYNTATIHSGDSVDVSIGNISLNMGANHIKAYTVLAGDSNYINDTLTKITYLEAVMNLSFSDDFEGSDLWMPDTLLNQWQMGIPSKTNINSAHSPVNAWVTRLDTNYDNNSYDKLYTPKFLIPSYADSAYLKFWHKIDCQNGIDGGFVQARVNSGFWSNLGYNGDPASTNWTTANIGGTHMWSATNAAWQHSTYTLNFADPLSTFYAADTIQFRYIFYSNASTNNYDGWAIDDFEFTLPAIAQDGGAISIVNPDTSSQIGSPVTVKIVVKNFGFQNLTSIPAKYNINGSATWISETFTPATALLPNATDTFTFATTFTSPNATYQICAKTAVVGDLYLQNNQTCKSVNVTAAPADAGISYLSVTPIWPAAIGGIDTTKTSYATKPIVYIKNFGSTVISTLSVGYQVNSAAWVNETFTGSIASGDSAMYQFTTSYNPPISNYILHAKTTLTGDADLTNDQKNKPLYGLLDVGFEENANGKFTVGQNEPNPANGQTTILYFIPNSGKVQFELRNTLGQLMISKEADEIAGKHSIKIDATKLSAGVYYYTFEYNNSKLTYKMIINK